MKVLFALMTIFLSPLTQAQQAQVQGQVLQHVEMKTFVPTKFKEFNGHPTRRLKIHIESGLPLSALAMLQTADGALDAMAYCIGSPSGKSHLAFRNQGPLDYAEEYAFENRNDCLKLAKSKKPLTIVYKSASPDSPWDATIVKVVSAEEAREMASMIAGIQAAVKYGLPLTKKELRYFVENIVRPVFDRDPFTVDLMLEASRPSAFKNYPFPQNSLAIINKALETELAIYKNVSL